MRVWRPSQYLFGFLVIVGVGGGCGEMEVSDSSGGQEVSMAKPLTAEAAPRDLTAASGDFSPPAEVEAPQPSAAAGVSHSCEPCALDQGVGVGGHFKGVSRCCLYVPVVDDAGKTSSVCIPYTKDCSASWAAQATSSL